MERWHKIVVAVVVFGGLAVHTRLYMQDNVQSPQEEPRVLTNSDIVHLVNDLLASKSITRTAQFLLAQEIPLQQKIEILRLFVDNPAYGLTHDDIVQLILAVANGYAAGSVEQQAIFKILADNYEKLQETRPLLIAAQYKYYNVLESLATWSLAHVEHYKQLKADLTSLKLVALKNSLQHETPQEFRIVVQQLGGITPEQATDLAWQLVSSKGNVAFLAELKELGADLNSARNGKTMLVYAVMDNNLPMVQALVGLSVNINAFADPEIGTPVQQAFELGYKQIEKFLRDHGARER